MSTDFQTVLWATDHLINSAAEKESQPEGLTEKINNLRIPSKQLFDVTKQKKHKFTRDMFIRYHSYLTQVSINEIKYLATREKC
jgi:hypothetical protein